MNFNYNNEGNRANYSICDTLDTLTSQVEVADTDTKKHILNTITTPPPPPTVASLPSNKATASIDSCSSHNTTNNNPTEMNMNTDCQRNNTLNPIFNFWRNSTRRSGNWGSRTGTKKSFVWKYFFHPELHMGTKDLTHTQCILCDSLLAFNNSGTTTTMLNHLKSRHSEIVQQEYQQTKKSRCGLLTLREINKMTKVNYNLLNDEKKLVSWSVSSAAPIITTSSSPLCKRNYPFLPTRRGQRGRPPGSCRHLDYSITNSKLSQNMNDSLNSMTKLHNSTINNDVPLCHLSADQMEACTSNSSFNLVNDKNIYSPDLFWTVSNEFSALNNSKLLNTTLPEMGNNESTPSNEAMRTHMPVSTTFTSGLGNFSLHNPPPNSSNSDKELFSEIFTNYLSSLTYNFSNMQLNLSELANLYLTELYKQINYQPSFPINTNENLNSCSHKSSLNDFTTPLESSSNDTFKQKVTVNENELQNDRLKTIMNSKYLNNSSFPLTDLSMKSSQPVSVMFNTMDANEPLDLSFNTYKQQCQQQEKLLENLYVTSCNKKSPSIMDGYDNSTTDENGSSASAEFAPNEDFYQKSPKQISDCLLSMSENPGNQRGCSNSVTQHNESKSEQLSFIPWHNMSTSTVLIKSETANNQHDNNQFHHLKSEMSECFMCSSPRLTNACSPSHFCTSCEEFHHRLAYFLITDFHPPSILDEEGFKILISILWDKFRKANENINYNLEFNFLPSSHLMENKILTHLYLTTRLQIDNKIKNMIRLQYSKGLINIPNINIFLKFWSLSQPNNLSELSFEYVDIELHFCANIKHTYKRDNIFYGTFEITENQTISKILEPCWNLLCSSFDSQYTHILSEWPFIIVTNCSEYVLSNLKESFLISKHIILPCVDAHMNNAAQCAVCLPPIRSFLRNHHNLRQKLDKNMEMVNKSASQTSDMKQQTDETSLTTCLPKVLNLIKWTQSSLHLIPDCNELDLKLGNRIVELIEVVQKTERICGRKLLSFTASMIRPMLGNLYSMHTEGIGEDLSDQFYATMINYLKTTYNGNNLLNEFLIISAFLDPRFKRSLTKAECETAVNTLKTKIQSLDAYNQKLGINLEINYTEEFEHFISEYINEKFTDINENPLDWWSNQSGRSEKYDIFKSLASYYLSVPVNALNHNENDNCRNYSNKQTVNALATQPEKLFNDGNSTVQTNMMNQDTRNEICQEKESCSVHFNQYYQPDHSLELWSRIGRKFIPIYRFLRKNWDVVDKP
uniref:BED-type domain-containing protein n=1 Tax=Trichobilharzia regenti TaxID=157069 RepID=A0AA85JD78_TRIRE|nr:unnamed protein product [Trichobilharzia regenti]